MMLELAKDMYGAAPSESLNLAGTSPAPGTTDLKIRKEKNELRLEVRGCFEADQILDLLPASLEIKGRVKKLLLDLSQVNLIDTVSLSAIYVVLRKHTRLPVHLRLANLSSWVFRQLLLTPEPEFLDGLWSVEVRAGNAMLNIWPSMLPSSRCSSKRGRR